MPICTSTDYPECDKIMEHRNQSLQMKISILSDSNLDKCDDYLSRAVVSLTDFRSAKTGFLAKKIREQKCIQDFDNTINQAIKNLYKYKRLSKKRV
jgi:hypothetical protein